MAYDDVRVFESITMAVANEKPCMAIVKWGALVNKNFDASNSCQAEEMGTHHASCEALMNLGYQLGLNFSYYLSNILNSYNRYLLLGCVLGG